MLDLRKKEACFPGPKQIVAIISPFSIDSAILRCRRAGAFRAPRADLNASPLFFSFRGAPTILEFQEKATFVRIANAGLRESRIHDATLTRESPNYPTAG